jgi:hypothetical protein
MCRQRSQSCAVAQLKARKGSNHWGESRRSCLPGSRPGLSSPGLSGPGLSGPSLLAQVSLAQVSLAQVSLAQVSLAQVSLARISLAPCLMLLGPCVLALTPKPERCEGTARK